MSYPDHLTAFREAVPVLSHDDMAAELVDQLDHEALFALRGKILDRHEQRLTEEMNAKAKAKERQPSRKGKDGAA
jgi:hypothetical protein